MKFYSLGGDNMKPEDCGFVSEEVFESYKNKGCLGVFEGTPIYIIPSPNDKPIKVVYGNDWKVEDDRNELVFSKRLSEIESENLLMELFGTTDVGILDCSNMTEEEIAEIDRFVDEYNKIGCTSFQVTADELEKILQQTDS